MLLYKYLPAEHVVVLENGLIRFSPSDAFNDPFEMNPPCNVYSTEEEMAHDLRRRARALAEDIFIRAKERGRIPLPVELITLKLMHEEELRQAALGEDHLQQFDVQIREALKTLTQEMGVLSLSQHSDALTMWAHYAESHKGFVLGFDSTHPFFGSQEPDGNIHVLRPVKYQDVRQPFKVLKSPVVEDWLFAKSPEWKSEAEWRSIKMQSDADTDDPVSGLFKYPPEALKVVKLGARIEDSTRAAIFTALQGMALPPDFVCEEADLASDEYKLVFKPVDFRAA